MIGDAAQYQGLVALYADYGDDELWCWLVE